MLDQISGRSAASCPRRNRSGEPDRRAQAISCDSTLPAGTGEPINAVVARLYSVILISQIEYNWAWTFGQGSSYTQSAK
jgi:hypothetical protein